MKNNIRYKGNINNTSVIIFFNWRTKIPSDVTLLGRTTIEVFVMLVVVVVHSFLFFFLLLFFIHFYSSFCCCSSFIAFQRHLSPFRGLSPGFYTHFILSAQLIAEWFETLSFSTFPRSSCHSFTASPTVLSGHFLPTGVFYLRLLHRHFTCVYQGAFIPPWEPAVFKLILETQARPICLFDS